MAGQILGVLWTVVAVWFLLSVVSAPIFLLIRKARARGRRLFVDGPNEVLASLSEPEPVDHRWDVV